MAAAAERKALAAGGPDEQARAAWMRIKQKFGVGYKDVAELERPDVEFSKFTYGEEGAAIGKTKFADKSIKVARGLGDEGETVILRHEWKHTEQMWDRARGLQEQLYKRSLVYRFGLESEAHGFAVMSPEAGSAYAWDMARRSLFNPLSYAVELAAGGGVVYGGVKAVQAIRPSDGQ